MITAPSFELAATSNAVGPRAGRLTTAPGIIETPAFVVAAWEGVVSALEPEEVTELGAAALAVSALQLALRPGIESLTAVGGLHAFMRWPGPLLSDAGTSELLDMSLPSRHGDGAHRRILRVNGDGVSYASPLDGSRRRLTPEQSLAEQESLGADLITTLAAPGVSTGSRRRNGDPINITMGWVRRFLDSRTPTDQGVLGAIPLNEFAPELARLLVTMPLDGFVLYESDAAENTSLLTQTLTELPASKLRVLAARRSPIALPEAVELGVDLVVSDEPIRLARRGVLCTARGMLDLGEPESAARSAELFGPIDAGCCCPTCQRFSLAYLAHLFAAGELLANRLAALHNLAFTLNLFSKMRS